ncbi:MAG: twin-arginine translocase TatA/TatE family subunit [Nitrososphaerota archaeon]|nr:twin-arginine translocase TatA/TatE family subunit [Nitrososphaerota archaeon]
MALGDPIQWVVIGVVIIALFLWGPQKIPDLARALGRARKEFDNASKEMNDAMSGKVPQATTSSQASGIPAPEKTGDQILIETARQLGISTEGKTRDQISAEILSKAKS